jgi:hypothetical protein
MNEDEAVRQVRQVRQLARQVRVLERQVHLLRMRLYLTRIKGKWLRRVLAWRKSGLPRWVACILVGERIW